MTARHAAPGRHRPPQPDPHPDRLGAHSDVPCSGREPAADLLARLRTPKGTPR